MTDENITMTSQTLAHGPVITPVPQPDSMARQMLNNVPQVTIFFWIYVHRRRRLARRGCCLVHDFVVHPTATRYTFRAAFDGR